jgi:crossover junction endodeoxyribonuclease RuvC
VRAVGFDPGLAATGFAALERGGARITVVGTGILRTPPAEPLEARLELLFNGIHGVLDSLAPDFLVIEDLFSTPTLPRTAILMAHARAMIYLVARQRKVAAFSVTPAEVKRAVTSSGIAGKEQVARAVQALLGLAALPRPSHVADALALAFTGLSRAGGAGLPGRR